MSKSLPLLTLIALGLAVPALAQDGRGVDMLFGRIDADGNGEVSMEELGAARATQFQRLDADADGTVTLAEMTEARERLARLVRAAGDPAERFARQDQDGNGALTEAEFTALPPAILLIDVDGNGAISRDEFDRARDAISQ
ncbi:MAG: calcium-binding protein [Tabrizicola sp.]|jgi:Ca2+-binding EF-hand superfamily protein|nr:calcium-binding protein [Tabrizicola sp.]